MSYNYVNIYKIIKIYDKDGIDGLVQIARCKKLYIDDNYSHEIFELIKNKGYSEIDDFIEETRKNL